MSNMFASNATATSKLPTIIIAGAGIAGLALAIALRRKGISPLVIERRERGQLGSEGIFLALAPNGLNALRGLNLAEAVVAKGIVTTGIQLRNEHGRPLGLIDYSTHADNFAAPSVTIRRGALSETLLEAALVAGVDVRFGVQIDGLTESADEVTISAGGESMTCSFLVGADGLHSTVRRLALPHLPTPVFNGLIGSGGIVDVPAILSTSGRMVMTFGRRAFFGYIKQAGGPVYWFDSYPSDAESLASRKGAELARELQDLHRDDLPDNRAILAAETSVSSLYPDYDIPSLAGWFTNRVVLLGDAAHAVTPHSGQGASMALEDSLVLSACIEAEESARNAFRRFESLRRRRVEAAVKLGRQGGQQKKAQSWLSLRVRDLILPMVIPLGQRAQERLFSFRADLTPLAQPNI